MERRGTLERFVAGRINKLSNQVHAEDVGDRGVCDVSHISMFVNGMDVGSFPI